MPRSPRKQPAVERHVSSSSEDEDDVFMDDDKGRGTELIAETNFDAYFKANATRLPTSNSVFSSLIEPLSLDEYDSLIKIPSLCIRHDDQFDVYKRELDAGFNLLFYGLGSKKTVLDQFASDVLSQSGPVFVADAYEPEFSLKSLYAAIDQQFELGATTPEAIYTHFGSGNAGRVFLVLHSLDALALRSAKSRASLSLLALNPYIHLVASVDHINAPLLFSSTECSARKHPRIAPDGQIPHTRGYAWVWHDLTTLAGYDRELAHADRSSISGVRKPLSSALTTTNAGAQVGGQGQQMTETAATHVLAAVTARAKQLFELMAQHQLGVASDDDRLSYDALFNLARDKFLATSDGAMRSLLAEFRDHGLVASVSGGALGGETLWIPMRKERLERVLQALQKGSAG